MTDVLIIEPSKELALVIAQALARQERSSAIAHTSQSAIEQADKSTPRLVILELLMPKHNGLEFIHEFRSYPEWLNIPIVIYSQMPKEDLGVTDSILEDMGVAAHLYKSSVTLDELIKNAEKLLE
ncbi:response regulator [Candidatus Parcubacteria bacterium]|nr:response regulator [Candidatus Parcubacteria bacterium]